MIRQDERCLDGYDSTPGWVRLGRVWCTGLAAARFDAGVPDPLEDMPDMREAGSSQEGE